MEKKIEQLIGEMTLEEKASLCSGMNKWKTESIDRLNIPSIIMTDGPHGVRKAVNEDDFGAHGVDDNEKATGFPTASALASSWDRELLSEIGQALGKESKALDVSILLGPGVNMKRSPLGGRNFEYYSEDPYLAGEIGTAYVKGLQGEGVGACVKHFACNNQEFERMSISSEVDERALREIYLPAFEKIVKEANPWSIMAAYNKVNGIHATENPLLLDILRKEWGYNGVVMSDWGAVNNRVMALKAGLDLEMPGASPANDKKIVEAVKSGELDESILDETVKRNLSILFKALESTKEVETIDFNKHHELARKAAVNSMILLKNEDRTLPLDSNTLKSMAVIGELAVEPRIQGGGSSKVNTTQVDIPLDKISENMGDNVSVNFARGYDLNRDYKDEKLIIEAVEVAKSCEIVVLFMGLPDLIESEGYDRKHMNIPENQVLLLNEIAKVNKKIVVVLNNGSAVTMGSWIKNAKALLEGWLTGQGSGSAVADILFGKANPCGKLTETYPLKLEHNPSYLNFPGVDGKVKYEEGIFIGYRYYDKRKIDVMYPFGHGLSYTEFEYSNLNVSKNELEDTEELIIEAEIKNVGSVEGAEIIQLYVRDKESRLIRPEKELKGFEKVFLKQGESKKVIFKLRKRDFSYFDPSKNYWIMETGEFDILLGSSLSDIRLEETINVISTDKIEINLTGDSPVSEWLMEEKSREIFFEFLDKVRDRVENSLQSENAEMVLGMPLKKVMYFDTELASNSEEIIKNMIKKVNS
ncbi:beta-glucosidase family protein [Oceanirhabdus sp. W0125-5]|uniref:beta-glucosidase family protein n=1 Tax=Oceanirhabdus sp. W0125-5 TaxID=2999116 RepID=UPI0022F2FA16|nr:glycoside hydrolase family 3 C-terminal domain-containing protein [Oceanirhabdus sp. W0125-5]WBW95648.1 glycoside hydrolase family 3 C-terminal domain-containing protein [Oceanirhabdus sp. W0125-5]